MHRDAMMECGDQNSVGAVIFSITAFHGRGGKFTQGWTDFELKGGKVT
jgi:hypothetical protein